MFNHHWLERFRVKTIEADAVAILRGEICALVGIRIVDTLYAHAKVGCERDNLLGCRIHEIEIIVVHARSLALWHSVSYTTKRLWACLEQHLALIAHIHGIAYESIFFHQHSTVHGLQVEIVISLACGRPLFERVGSYREEHMSSVGSDIAYIYRLVCVCKRNDLPSSEVEACKRVAVAPSWLSVVRMYYFIDTLFLGWSILRLHKYSEILCWRDIEIIVGHFSYYRRHFSCRRLYSLQL